MNSITASPALGMSTTFPPSLDGTMNDPPTFPSSLPASLPPSLSDATSSSMPGTTSPAVSMASVPLTPMTTLPATTVAPNDGGGRVMSAVERYVIVIALAIAVVLAGIAVSMSTRLR
jgi:hypothetical protein